MKTSFFKEYYCNRLKNLRAFFIASIVLNILTGPAQFISLVITGSLVHNDYYSFNMTLFTALTTLTVTMPVVAFISLILPAMSRKHLLRKDYTDTFNALPVTYKERYWGDLLAELTAFISPMIVCAIISICCSAVVSNIEATDVFFQNLPIITTNLEISFIISCIAGIALTGLMTQCCGNAKSAVLYSVLTGAIVPTIIMGYGKAFSECALGIDENISAITISSAIPPFGIYINGFSMLTFSGMQDNPFIHNNISVINSIVTHIVSLAITAILIIGGYYIGKKRKAELTGNDIIFRVFSTIISITLAVATLAVGLDSINEDKASSKVVGILLTTLVMYFAFELLNKKKSIKIVRSLIGYVAVCAVGFGLYGIANATNCFGAEDYVPKADSVKTITVNDYSNFDTFYYNNEIAISAITKKHSELLLNKDNLLNGNGLTITYTLKNGSLVQRCYTANDKNILKEMSLSLAKLPQSGNNRFSILTNEELDVRFSVMLNGETSKTVKPEKTAEFKKILSEEILAILSTNSKTLDADTTITLRARYYDEYGERNAIWYDITPDYTNTITFLNNPDNTTDSIPETDFNTDDIAAIYYKFDGGEINITFTPENPSPEELCSFITADEAEASEYFTVLVNGEFIYIKKADEERAKEIFFNAFTQNLSTTEN